MSGKSTVFENGNRYICIYKNMHFLRRKVLMPNNINQKQAKKHLKTFRMLLILGYSCKKKVARYIFFN